VIPFQPQMHSIDLNCDMGEGCGHDEELLEFVSSANIACGFHAGGATTMRRTAEAAIKHGVAIGAHPSYPDRENFGRTNIDMPPAEVFDIVAYQVGAMRTICETAGGKLRHVKPHGALYNQAARDNDLAGAIAEAVRAIDPQLILYGLSGSQLISEGRRAGLKTASEVFADRTYQPDGSLTPRSQPNALITDAEASVGQVLRFVTEGSAIAAGGKSVIVEADTICLHGDGEHAVEFARAIRTGLQQRGIAIAPISR